MFTVWLHKKFELFKPLNLIANIWPKYKWPIATKKNFFCGIYCIVGMISSFMRKHLQFIARSKNFLYGYTPTTGYMNREHLALTPATVIKFAFLLEFESHAFMCIDSIKCSYQFSKQWTSDASNCHSYTWYGNATWVIIRREIMQRSASVSLLKIQRLSSH